MTKYSFLKRVNAYSCILGCASILVTAIISGPAYAHDSIDDLLALDIESLASLEVSVASKKSEKISEAPGVISVLTAHDIEKYGAHNLHDLLGRMSGVYAFGHTSFPDSVASIRGGSTDGVVNRHVLILLNGRPMRDPLRGGINSTIYRAFPIDVIERIEMIRGPGSVLYGSGAFSGVINVITKTADTLESNSASLGYGTFNTRKGSLTAAKSFDDHDFDIIGSAQFSDSDGWDYNYTGLDGVSGRPSRGESHHGSFVQARYGNLTIAGMDGYEDVEVIPSSDNLPLVDDYKVRRQFADVGYTLPLWSDWEAQFNVTYNNYFNHRNRGGVEEKGNSYLFETSFSGTIFDDVNLLIGAVSDNYDVHISPTVTNSNTWYSGYIQADYKPFNWMKLVGGLQMNKPNGIEKDFSPRVGVILTPIDHWGVKLLYGQAFRSPFSNETALSLPFLVGNADLVPETIETTDLQIFYTDSKYNASLTAYRSIQKDTILIDTVPNPSTFVNGGTITYEGLEFEGDARLTDEWQLEGSLTWQTGEDWQGNNDIIYVPHYMVKLGVSYEPLDSFYTLGIYNSYYSAAAKTHEFLTTAGKTNPSPGPYNWMTANINVDLPEALKYSKGPDMTFSLYGENLLNEEVFFPEGGVSDFNSAPGRTGRGVYGRLTMRF